MLIEVSYVDLFSYSRQICVGVEEERMAVTIILEPHQLHSVTTLILQQRGHCREVTVLPLIRLIQSAAYPVTSISPCSRLGSCTTVSILVNG